MNVLGGGGIGTESPVALIVTALLSGGGGASVGAIATAWRSRKIVPAERDNLIVGSAQTAVLSMKDSLTEEARRADRAEAECDRLRTQLDAKDTRIAALERSLDVMRERLEGQMEQLEKLRLELHEIRTAT